METCPYCGAPGSFQEAADGCCYVCGMVLPESSGGSQSRAVEAAAEAEAEIVESSAGDAAKVGLEQQAPPTIHFESTDPPAINLIQPRKLSPEYARRVTMAWQATKSPFKNPQETLNSSATAAHDSSNLMIGQRSVGRVEDAERAEFELKEVIGEGNMGTVWSARQASLDREVAIKMPKPTASASSLGRELFISEVVVTGQLDHPNIVPIYDLARDASGQLFYAMKRVEGRSWDACMHESSRTRHDNVEILMKVCDAIRFAHDRGVIHRDIKPQNIMVGSYGEVSVMDWGIAMRLPEGSYMPGLAKISPSGTPAYMAPEMATGNANEIGMHTDVYLLGAVLYEIITGEPPHPAPPMTNDPTVQQNACLLIAARNVITPAKETGELVDIAYKAMATDISNRFVSVDEFQESIRDYFSHAESIKLTDRGEAHLTNARELKNGVYEDYAKARFAFDEAVQLWPENSRARRGLAQASVDYAGSALQRGDYALGLSLVDDQNPAHTDLKKKLTRAKRKSAQARLVAAVSALVAVGALIGGGAYSTYRYWGEKEARAAAELARNEANRERQNAVEQQVVAEKERDEKETQRGIAVAKTEEVQKLNESLEQRGKQLAAANSEIGEKNVGLEKLNVQLSDQVTETKKAQAETEVASYRSEIGDAAGQIRRNEFTNAEAVLVKQEQNPVQKSLRDWEWGHLMYLARKPAGAVLTVDGLPRVGAVAISPDQRWIAAAADNGSLHIWWKPDPKKDEMIKLSSVPIVRSDVLSLDISKNGRLLAVGGATEVHLWELPAGGQESRLVDTGKSLKCSDQVLSVAFSPKSDEVLTANRNSKVQLWSLSNPNEAKQEFRASITGRVWQASFSPDGRRIVTASDDGKVRIFDAETGQELKGFEGHRGPVYCAVFSPDGNSIVSGGRDRRLLAWNLNSTASAESKIQQIQTRLRDDNALGADRAYRQLGEHAAEIHSLAFSSDGSALYSASDDNSIKVWNISQGAESGVLNKTLRGHGGWVRSCAATDDKHVLSGSYDGRVMYWDVANYAFPRVLRGASDRSLADVRYTSAAATSNGRWIATAAENGIVTVWDMEDLKNPVAQSLGEGHEFQATTAAYFQGGSRLLTAAGDNSTVVWDASLGNQLLRIGGWNAADRKEGTGWRGIGAAANKSLLIATGSDDKTLLAKLWDANTGKLVATLATPAETLASRSETPEAVCVAFSPEDRTVFIGDQFGACYLFSAKDGAFLKSFTGHKRKVSAVGFLSEDLVLTAGADNVVYKWDLGKEPIESASMFPHDGPVLAMEISKDREQFITAVEPTNDETVLRVWNIGSGKVIQKVSRSELTAGLDQGRSNNANGANRSISPPSDAITRAQGNDKPPIVRSISMDSSGQQALITLYNPGVSDFRLGNWDWKNGGGIRWISSAYPDTSMALHVPNQPGAILTVGGRGARVRFANNEGNRTFLSQPGVKSVSFSHNDQLLACAGSDGSIKLWRLDTASIPNQWKADRSLPRAGKSVNSVMFHPQRDDLLLSGCDDGAISVWQRAGNDWNETKLARGGSIRQAIFADDEGSQILVAGDDGVKLLNVAGGQGVTRIGDDTRAQCVTTSRDGKWIVAGFGDVVYVFSREKPQGAPIALNGHSANVRAIAFSEDGSRLFTAGDDFRVKLWDTSAWSSWAQDQPPLRELLTLEHHNGAVVSASIFTNTEYSALLTAGADGQAILWPTTDWKSAPAE